MSDIKKNGGQELFSPSGINPSMTPPGYKEIVNLKASGLAPRPGVPFVIGSAASPRLTENIAQVTAGHPYVNQLVNLGFLGQDLGEMAVWQLTPEGRIVSPYYPDFVIGINDNNQPCLASWDEEDNSQCWIFSPSTSGTGGYTIANKSDQTNLLWLAPDPQYYGYDGGQDTYSGYITLGASGQSGYSEEWVFLPPAGNPMNSFYIMSAMNGEAGSESGGNPYAVSAQSGDANIFLLEWQPGLSNQLWSFLPDGSIVQANDVFNYDAQVLTADPSGDSPVFWSGIACNPAPSSQFWTFKNSMLEVCGGTLSLNTDSGKTGLTEPLLAYEVQDNKTNSEWYIVPGQSVAIDVWFYLETKTSQVTDGNTYVLSAAGSNPGDAVQIDLLKKGSLAQLWKMTPEGILLSALDQSLCLSATLNSSSCVQTIGASGMFQTWCMLPSGMLATGSAGSVQYLNVQSGLSTLNGGEVLTEGFNGSSPIWKVIFYEEAVSGQWFTIESSLSSNEEAPLLLTVADDWLTVNLNPPLGGYITKEGEPSLGQLWQYNMQGNIVSAVNPNLVLTGPNADGAVTVAALIGNAADQQWSWGYSQSKTIKGKDIRCGVLKNIGDAQATQVLWASGRNSFVSLQTMAGTEDTANQLWYIVPACPNYGQFTTIQNVQSADREENLYLILPSSDTYPAVATTAGRGDVPAESTWQFIYPGYIVNSVNAELVLSLQVDATQSSPVQPAYSQSVVAYLRQPGYQPFQLWKATPEGLIINHFNGQVLTGNTEGQQLLTAVLQGTNPLTALQIWEFSPGKALATILVQPPVPYPQGSSSFASIYNKISNELGLPGGIRSQYFNLSAPMASYQSRMHFVKVPQGTDLSEWESVVVQLDKEMTAVAAVQALFQQADTFHLALTQAQSLSLSEAVTAAALPDGPATKIVPPKKGKGWIADIVEGLTYTVMNFAAEMIPGGEEAKVGLKVLKKGLPAAANLMEMGMSAGMDGRSARNSHNQAGRNLAKLQHFLDGAYNYEMSVLELQQSLLNIFNAAGSALGQIEVAILQDWGKLEQVYTMTLNNQDLSSLYWPSTMATTLANEMLPGYTIGVLQALISANQSFNIEATMHTSYGESLLTGLQSDGQTFIEKNSDSTYNIYKTTVNQQVLDMVWSNGVDPLVFFKNLNGWQQQYIYQNLYGDSDNQAELAASIIITIENCTSIELDLSVSLYSLFGSNYSDSGQKPPTITPTLEAYGAIRFAGTPRYLGLSGSFVPVTGSIGATDSFGKQVFSIELDNSGDIYHANAITYRMQDLSYNSPYEVSCTNYYGNIAPMALFTIKVTTVTV